ncbi:MULTISPECIES: sensor histidine kinase [Cysteiniphilum]|uniref:sensor histidine kinase n=1 Tax=Cysteiniphilum TaxID=2056696 RepID=UPI00177F20D7|nr:MULTISPECIES: HAMP domain-containing sensor histidine kinase [Cysteiniphilum]
MGNINHLKKMIPLPMAVAIIILILLIVGINSFFAAQTLIGLRQDNKRLNNLSDDSLVKVMDVVLGDWGRSARKGGAVNLQIQKMQLALDGTVFQVTREVSAQPQCNIKLNREQLTHDIIHQFVLHDNNNCLSVYSNDGNGWLNIYIDIESRPIKMSMLAILLQLLYCLLALLVIFVFLRAIGIGGIIIRLRQSSLIMPDSSPKKLNLFKANTVKNLIEANYQAINEIVKLKLNMAAVSHDLKSPVSKLLFRVRNNYIDNLQSICEKTMIEMNTMLNDILISSKPLDRKKCVSMDIKSFLKEIVAEYQENAMLIPVNYSQKINVLVDRALFKRAIDNLINNAIKYGNYAQISYVIESKYVNIYIQDQGYGVDKSVLSGLKKPFSQGDSALPGHGLGLYIANEIIQKHQGELTFANNTNSTGLTVTIKLKIIEGA